MIARLVLLCGLLLLSAGGLAQDESVLRDAGTVPCAAGGWRRPRASKVFIVQLRSPSAAERQATLPKARCRTMARNQRSLRQEQPNVKAWVAEIESRAAACAGKSGARREKIYSYRYGLNGFAARMSIAQAQKLEHDAGCAQCLGGRDSPDGDQLQSRLPRAVRREDGLRSAEGLDGDGIIIGVIDSGIAPEHPALQDTREADRPRLCRSSWAEATLLGKWLCRRYRKTARCAGI